MLRISHLLLLSVFVVGCAQAQSFQRGPYTVRTLADGVFNIEDANDSNPEGVHRNDDGSFAGMNNCSDMYLVVGGERALLIDLSNAIQWDTTASTSLRAIVHQLWMDEACASRGRGRQAGMIRWPGPAIVIFSPVARGFSGTHSCGSRTPA